MADFQAQVSIEVVCAECGKELDASVGGKSWDEKLMVERCDCQDNDNNTAGYESRDDEVDGLKEELASARERIVELESKLESLEEYAQDRACAT